MDASCLDAAWMLCVLCLICGGVGHGGTCSAGPTLNASLHRGPWWRADRHCLDTHPKSTPAVSVVHCPLRPLTLSLCHHYSVALSASSSSSLRLFLAHPSPPSPPRPSTPASQAALPAVSQRPRACVLLDGRTHRLCSQPFDKGPPDRPPVSRVCQPSNQGATTTLTSDSQRTHTHLPNCNASSYPSIPPTALDAARVSLPCSLPARCGACSSAKSTSCTRSPREEDSDGPQRKFSLVSTSSLPVAQHTPPLHPPGRARPPVLTPCSHFHSTGQQTLSLKGPTSSCTSRATC